MDRRQRTRLSRRLSYHLRHDPAAAGVRLDRAGWVRVDDLLDGLTARGFPVSRDQLETLAAASRRFELSADGARIRALYGHSVPVDPGHHAVRPPATLYHGTVPAALDAIMRDGLRPMGRQHVHLSGTPQDARRVGRRRGTTVVLAVDARGLVADGLPVRQAAREVWLVDHVPPDRLWRWTGEDVPGPSLANPRRAGQCWQVRRPRRNA